MNIDTLYRIWGMLFILCAGLGFLPEPEGSLRVFLTGLSVLFFVPPAWILWLARGGKAPKAARTVTKLAAVSLGVTLVLMVLSIVLAVRGDALGELLHALLVILAAPMICSGYWALSLFLWACLLMAGLQLRKK